MGNHDPSILKHTLTRWKLLQSIAVMHKVSTSLSFQLLLSKAGVSNLSPIQFPLQYTWRQNLNSCIKPLSNQFPLQYTWRQSLNCFISHICQYPTFHNDENKNGSLMLMCQNYAHLFPHALTLSFNIESFHQSDICSSTLINSSSQPVTQTLPPIRTSKLIYAQEEKKNTKSWPPCFLHKLKA